ncbi:MAG: hypothetical protein KDA37_18580 [Planctomycetales bacterium]|nr:hypothetical protein [Planctomycetales bacterium]
MISEIEIPTQEDFLAAPDDVIAAVAPRSMVYAPGGTRRRSVFDGVEPWSVEYVQRSYTDMVACLDVIFRYGVEHVFTPALMASHAGEVDDVEQQLMIPVARFVTDDHLIALCHDRGWRVRIVPSAYHEVLQPYLVRWEEKAPQNAKHTWWMTLTPSYESWWSNLFRVMKSVEVGTRADAIRAIFGEDIPDITLYCSFGKPTISPDLFPSLLMDNVQCYWSQLAGYSLTDQQFRKVLYDYAYMRPTWQRDKKARAKEALAHQEIWERDVILGLGTRLGPFWYPESQS